MKRKIENKKSYKKILVRPWRCRAAWTRSGWYWSITAVQALRSEYLAWPAANIVKLKLRLLM